MQPSRRPLRQAPAVQQQAIDIKTFPAWATVDAKTTDLGGAFLAAGAGLASLDGILRQTPPFAGALRQRLALRAASASANILRFREDGNALRDALHLAVSEDAGPAGRIHRLWRDLAMSDPPAACDRAEAVLKLIDAPDSTDASELAAALRNAAAEPGDPVTAAAAAATRAHAKCPGPEGEVLACWAADTVLARRLRWRKAAPMLLAGLLDPTLRRGSSGRRPRPNDSDWPQAVAHAYALAAFRAHGLATDLARHADKLLTVAPKLRAKRAEQVVDALLADDCVAPTRIARRAGLSDRAARRLLERLVDLGAVRELSGRPSFRLYGL